MFRYRKRLNLRENSAEYTDVIADGRLDYYEQILSQIATGVFILLPTVPGVPETLDVTMVNEMGRKFFGRADAVGAAVLSEACN